MRRAFLLFYLAGFMLLPRAVRAQTFGQAGQLVLSGGTQLSVEHMSFSTPSGSQSQGSTTSAVVAPSVDVFVVRGLSVGARIAYEHSELSQIPSGSVAINSLSVGPRVGYNVTISDRLSFWPSASLSFGDSWFGSGSSSEGVALGGDAPLLLHVAPHFFVGLGPNVLSYVTSKTSTQQGTTDAPRLTEFGAALTMGGWLEAP
jgi:hypothetical protein